MGRIGSGGRERGQQNTQGREKGEDNVGGVSQSF